MSYSVNLWGSNPDENNDDCWTGQDFTTQAEAEAFYNNPFTEPFFAQLYKGMTQYIQLTGPNLVRTRKNEHFVPPKPDREWEREIARQAGMMGGCEAYNDALGY